MFYKMTCNRVREAEEIAKEEGRVATYKVGDYIFYEPSEKTQKNSCSTFYERMTDSYPINLNWSDIQSTLIQAAGRWCESYASDIVIDINWIQKKIDNPEPANLHQLLMFRKSGVNSWNVFPCGDGYTFGLPEHNDAFDGMLSEMRALYLINYTCTPIDSCDPYHPGYYMEIKCSRVD